ncbi:hypothetical protein [Vibrio sp. TBV020]|uniref:hypothetical protein n=1 Tax=Vibrio sp. TBV020 TaxID=3137398 RepID=UPI0038CD9686
MVALMAGAFIAYDHFHTQALFTRTVGNVLQAMKMQLSEHQAESGCLTVPDEATVQGLTQAGLLVLDADLPWQLDIDYQTGSNHQVTAYQLTLTASSEREGEQLRQFAPKTEESWSYTGQTLTVQRLVFTPTDEVMKQEYDPTTGCFAW